MLKYHNVIVRETMSVLHYVEVTQMLNEEPNL